LDGTVAPWFCLGEGRLFYFYRLGTFLAPKLPLVKGINRPGAETNVAAEPRAARRLLGISPTLELVD
jgi:hypothetical protein